MSQRDCLQLSNLADLTDQQYISLRVFLKHKLEVKLPCVGTLQKLRQDQYKALRQRLGFTTLFKPNLEGVSVNLGLSLTLLCELYGVGMSPLTRWKLSVDGRPNGKRSEISVGVVPLSFGSDFLQSSNAVYPLAVFKGTLLWNKINTKTH
jgi:hypothetical protein